MKERKRPYTVGQVAKLADLHPGTIWHHIKKGNLKAWQWETRGWYYIDQEVAHAWLNKRRARIGAEDDKRVCNAFC